MSPNLVASRGNSPGRRRRRTLAGAIATAALTAAAAAPLTSLATAAQAAPAQTAPASAVAPPTTCAGTGLITCTYNVAPGTYQVTVQLGSKTAAANTGIEVEARRPVISNLSTKAGQIVTRTVTVDVRTPESMPTGEEGDGTAGLQVILTGRNPSVIGVSVVAAPSTPQLFVISDSTAADWLKGPKRGWGQEIPQLFGPGISVSNYADSGESSISWLSNSKLFPTVKPLIRKGDEVLIQLAHNDKSTSAATFTANLQKIIDGVKAQGGSPVLVTPPVRHLFNSNGTITSTGLIVNGLGVDLPAQIRALAAKDKLPLIDVTAKSQALLQSLGPDASWRLYLTVAHDGVSDQTHFSSYGGQQIAGLVTAEMTRLKLPFAAYLLSATAPVTTSTATATPSAK